MKCVAIAGSALLAVASALPAVDTGSITTLNLANFDYAFPYLSITPIEVYQKIFWRGMSLAKTGNIQTAAIVRPNSGGNVATFGRTNVVTIQQGQPSMTVNYPNSPIKDFTLQSFYFACAISQPVSIIGVPRPCTMTIKGYSDDAGQRKVAEQSFRYQVRTPQTSEQMLRATMNTGFRNVKRVDFFITGDYVNAGLIDSVRYSSRKA